MKKKMSAASAMAAGNYAMSNSCIGHEKEEHRCRSAPS